jgi:hypothetical protein
MKRKDAIIHELKTQLNLAIHRQHVAEREAADDRNKRLTLETQVYDLWRSLNQPIEKITREMKGFGFGDYRSLRTRLLDRLQAYGVDPDTEATEVEQR